MDNKKRMAKMLEEKYKVILGVTKETFEKMLEILESAYKEMHQQGGSASRLSILDKLVVMLGYYHDYRTMENIAFDYDVSKSRICDAISWVEETLIKDGTFALPSKREMLKSNNKISVAIIDVTEYEIERPKKTKTILFWKEKKHTLKDQVVINGETGEIIDVFEDKGSVHDFEIFKKSKFRLPGNVLLLADKALIRGYIFIILTLLCLLTNLDLVNFISLKKSLILFYLNLEFLSNMLTDL